MSLVDSETGEVVDVVIPAMNREQALGHVEQMRGSLSITAELVLQAWQGQVWKPLGYRNWESFLDEEFPDFAVSAAARHVLMVSLRNAGMSQRQISRTTGASRNTIAAQVAQIEPPDEVVGGDGKTYPAKVTRRESISETTEYPTHREGVGDDDESNAGDANNGDGADSHDVGQLDPEPTPVDPAPSPGAENGEVEAATDGDEVESSAGPSSAATSPKPRLVTVHDFLKPVTSHSWLTGVDPAVFWDLDNPQAADTFLAWIDSMTAYAVTLRDNKPNHLRLVEGNA